MLVRKLITAIAKRNLLAGKTLEIGTSIPKEIVTKVQAILAKRDSGKTYTAGVEEEELMKLEQPIVVIDGMHAHYGLRSKYPIPILGPIDPKEKVFSPDIELRETDAELVAEMIVSLNQSCILDISNWDEETQRSFVAGFLEKLFQLNDSPRHIFVEEADSFAPQKGITENGRLSKYALNKIVRRGRGRGLGVTMITQRPAVIDKDILTQADVYIIKNFIAEQDIKAIKGLITNFNLSKQLVTKTLEKISKFKPMEALLYSPSWLDRLDVFNVRTRETYHAGRTPEYNENINFHAIPINVEKIIQFLNNQLFHQEEEIVVTENGLTLKEKIAMFGGASIAIIIMVCLI